MSVNDNRHPIDDNTLDSLYRDDPHDHYVRGKELLERRTEAATMEGLYWLGMASEKESIEAKHTLGLFFLSIAAEAGCTRAEELFENLDRWVSEAGGNMDQTTDTFENEKIARQIKSLSKNAPRYSGLEVVGVLEQYNAEQCFDFGMLYVFQSAERYVVDQKIFNAFMNGGASPELPTGAKRPAGRFDKTKLIVVWDNQVPY